MSAIPLINDPDAIKALLESIKASEEWRKLANPDPPVSPSSAGTVQNTALPPASSTNVVGALRPEDASAYAGSTSDAQATPSVASLLSQLHSSSTSSPQSLYPSSSSEFHSDNVATPEETPPPPIQYDTRQLTFQQALPYLARMVEDKSFIATVKKMKQDQVDLERKLWEERRNIQRTHTEKVNLEMKKANITGGLTKYQADTMADGFRKELERFDGQRALPAWDSLVAKQQTILESLRVPAMFVTSEPSDRERQQRVVHVLASMDL